MIKNIYTNWNYIRVIRLVLGVIVMIQAVYTKTYLFLIPGILFTGMALFNTSCCGSNGCAIPKSENKKQQEE
ncbi:hypothetical protein [Flavobacterium sp.]|jgi:hypothetical protein|uniref:hypothetical protein n=1 Tax=Flavobacterium sp. TaxID=239 RepID=UPI002B4B4B69|nr:hypothetical protein [Flavobacterium sp.]HLF53260.1 hypothetical protein [Flavobacterium sp.]